MLKVFNKTNEKAGLVGLYATPAKLTLAHIIRNEARPELMVCEEVVVAGAEARGDKDTDPWVNVDTFTGLAGTNAGSESYNLTTILAGAAQSLSANTQVRFRVAANYNVTGNFIIDDVQLSTSTTDCGVGAVHHYEISHIGYGVMCEAYQITFEAHDVAHTPVAPPLSTVVNLSTSAGKGSWSALPGFPNITDAVLADGLATYTFGLNQTSFAANFNLTNPLTPTKTIHFNIQQGAITELGLPGDVTDPFFTFAESGFIFTNNGGTQTIGVQIAGKRSNLAPANGIFLRAVDTNLDTLECEALFGGQTVQIEMQIQCTNPSSCATVGAEINGTVVPENDNYIPGPGGTIDTNVSVSFPAASAISDEIVLNYPDAGEIQIHAEYQLPINNNIVGNTEMSYMRGSSQPFVVRPFGFSFDMSANVDPFADDGTPDDGFGNPDAGGSAFVKAGEPFNVNLQAIAYIEGAGQDTLVAGQPDADADLSANPLTPNFGNENAPGDRPVATITHTVTLPVAHAVGALPGNVTFDTFAGGQDNNDVSFSEVGIIAMSANLVSDYLGSGQGLTGNVSNVGRFTPDHYSITSSAHINRIGLDGFCSPASTFTYMGEPLQLTVNLEARNTTGQPTRNYYGGFERLSTVLGSLNFSAMDLDTMDVLTGRLDSSGINSVAWNNVFLNGDPGEGTVSGNLLLDKAATPDGPYDMFTVGFVPVDADGVTALAAELNLDLPPLGSTDTITVMTTGMRYGRLVLSSTGGSEISNSVVAGAGLDIPLTFVLEYYNDAAMNFVVNPLDDCTTLSSNNLQVINDSYTEGLTANPLGIGTPSPSLSINIGVQTGTLTVLENGSTSSSSAAGDVPIYISSPFAADDNNTATGSVLLEYDLDTAVDVDPGAGVQNVLYDYLKFDWRNIGELYDENPDGSTPDNPRSIIDFGVFQGHNRVINWQEILLTPD